MTSRQQEINKVTRARNKHREATKLYVAATAAWAAHAKCNLCHGNIRYVINCPEGRQLVMKLEAASTTLRKAETEGSEKDS